jgi:FAD/FMN-containing dehydrogenase
MTAAGTSVPGVSGRTEEVRSWGNVARGSHRLVSLRHRFDSFPPGTASDTVLPFGRGRSYGDSCLNIGGGLLLGRSLDRFISFDVGSGLLTCEGGVLLSEILKLVTHRGWFLPVVPGTQHVTIGGAIANDVHGKNHETAGTFARHVRGFELLRSTGERLYCTPTQNADWFAATCGGLGLTGLIVWAQIQLKPIPGVCMDVETVRFERLADFFRLSEESHGRFEYAVAWIDCLARGGHIGRGVFQRANHCAAGMRQLHPPTSLPFPATLPFSLVNPVSLRLFNALHYRRAARTPRRTLQHYQKFFFPLDGIQDWNRMYGRRGFHQYQCVLPSNVAEVGVRALLDAISAARMGSFLAVLKQFGTLASPGLLSFPMPGVTLALDFPSVPGKTENLFARLDNILSELGGRLYPAKDCRMPAALFQRGYPCWRRLANYKDPRCQSTFWQRVTGVPT